MKNLLLLLMIAFLVTVLCVGYILLTSTINLWPTGNLIGRLFIVVIDLLWVHVTLMAITKLYDILKTK